MRGGLCTGFQIQIPMLPAHAPSPALWCPHNRACTGPSSFSVGRCSWSCACKIMLCKHNYTAHTRNAVCVNASVCLLCNCAHTQADQAAAPGGGHLLHGSLHCVPHRAHGGGQLQLVHGALLCLRVCRITDTVPCEWLPQSHALGSCEVHCLPMAP